MLTACSTGGAALRGGGNDGVPPPDGSASVPLASGGAPPASDGGHSGPPHQDGARATNSGQGFSEGEAEGDGGESLLGGPGSPYDEQQEWTVVPFTDPRTGQTYDIIDGRVIIAFKNPPQLPEVDPNYFDTERQANDQAYSVAYPSVVGDTQIAAFILAENLQVVSEWKCVRSLGALLPEGQSVQDAVTSWPLEYPAIIDSVDPDSVALLSSTPPMDPNDDRFKVPLPEGFDLPASDQWNINGTIPSLDVNIRPVWGLDEQNQSYYETNGVVAVLDTGVDYDCVINGVNRYHQDLVANSVLYGCNTGDDKVQTQFLLREIEGGEPWQWVKDLSADNATYSGHGTSVAGVICARAGNDGNDLQDNRDVAGIAYRPKYFPIAIKYRHPDFSKFSVINAYLALGCAHGCIDKRKEYGPGFFVPYYRIEVANLSFGSPPKSRTEELLVNYLTRYINLVCAAGNGAGPTSDWPASHPQALSVGAYNSTGGWVGRFASDIDIAAPGAGVWSTDLSGFNSFGFPLGANEEDCWNFSGTSIAAPHVAAVTLLTHNRFVQLNSPDPTPAEIRARVLAKQQMTVPSAPAGVGRVDAMRCIYEPW